MPKTFCLNSISSFCFLEFNHVEKERGQLLDPFTETQLNQNTILTYFKSPKNHKTIQYHDKGILNCIELFAATFYLLSSTE